MTETVNCKSININDLEPFANHPFKLYKDKRFDDMVESVKANGVLMPIIVRPIVGGKYEILAGHNRVEAAKAAGLASISATITDVTDDEALLVVTETNLLQRSFTDLSHSERATAIAARHAATKRQGKRTDLLSEVEALLDTFGQVGEKLRSDRVAGRKYDLSGRTISRYLRINELIPELKESLDSGQLPFTVCVILSFLRIPEQKSLANALADYKVDLRTAEILRKRSHEKELLDSDIRDILKDASVSIKVKPVKLSGTFLSQYFNEKQSAAEIEGVVAKALEKWFADMTE